MIPHILGSKPVVEAMEADLKPRVELLRQQGIVPKLAIVRVGANPDDLSYERMAIKRAESLDIAVQVFDYPENVDPELVAGDIRYINEDASIHGCLMFRPLPEYVDEQALCNMLVPHKDVDGISVAALGGIFIDDPDALPPATAEACIKVLDHYAIPLQGKRVVVVGRSLVIGKPVSMILHPALTDPDEIAAAFKSVVDTFGSLDILANNAGTDSRTKLVDYTLEEFQKVMRLNVEATFVCSQAAARIMIEQGTGGAIINTSSMVSIYGQPAGCAYPTSKFAVNGLTKSLARELAPHKIRVNAVAPGVTHTDMVDALPREVIEPLIKTIPLGRMGEPEDIANAFAFLASDEASYISGDVLSVDGLSRS